MFFDVREHMALNKGSSQGWVIASKCVRYETFSVNSRTKSLPNTASFKAEETLAFQPLGVLPLAFVGIANQPSLAFSAGKRSFFYTHRM